jgi:hypothetical protein
MPLDQRVIAVVAVILICVVLAGLFVRRRAASCWSFVAYLVAVALADLLIVSWPHRFWRQDFWIFKESVHNVLKLATALELMVRVFQPFPTAYVAVRRVVLLAVAGLAVLVWSSLRHGTGYIPVVGRLNPHVYDMTVWILVGLGGYCLWYHLPLDSLHKAILIGWVPYLLVYSVMQRSLAAFGWERGYLFNRTSPIAYLLLLAYWAHVAWKPAAGGDAGTRVGRLLDRREAR